MIANPHPKTDHLGPLPASQEVHPCIVEAVTIATPVTYGDTLSSERASWIWSRA